MAHEDEITITEKDVINTMDIFTKIPSILLGRWVSKNKNLVKTFEGQVNGYKNQVSPEDMQKLEIIMEMPVSELQSILQKAYLQTGKKQLKILSSSQARPFIETNLMELKRVL
ncbi:MAG: hypothetical protein KKF16_10990 [Euryarchaeota archaeon]|nr:hypothetical protein [Euryarchaeota archaeon]MBU4607759.1 hypothetical protein [Euryarchaeota archaeon]MBV1729873.1 hypothetical protein [Methanobacterium sp.]MBV1756117.1 hypothetical protein [Methanobacterium sp.]MBV1767159.1 hypothetical protein [Methanobacterium sp.]